MLAPWMGGAGAEPVADEQGGVSSLLAFWIGGAAPGIAVDEPAIPPGGVRRRDVAGVPLTDRRARLIGDEDEILLAMTLAAWKGTLQ